MIKRALVDLTVTTCVVGLNLGSVGGLGALLRPDRGGVNSLSAIALIAVTLRPLRTRLRQGVNLVVATRRPPCAPGARANWE